MNKQDLTCEFCKNSFKNKSYLTKHQKTSKYCIEIQKKQKEETIKEVVIDSKEKDIENDITKKNILINHEELNKNIQEQITISLTSLFDRLKEIENSITDIKKDIIRNNLIKDTILQNTFLNKIENKELIDGNLSDDSGSNISVETISNISNSDIGLNAFNNEPNLNKDVIIEQEEKQDQEEIIDSSIENDYKEIVDNLVYHIKILLNDFKINNKNILYILVELMKFIDNFNIENLDKKKLIIYCLKKFIYQNTDCVENKSEIKTLIDTFIDDLIDISISIATKKIKLKRKNSIFFPICF